MSLEPPPFQEASRCDVCNCSFSTFRRRHHCRCCGRTLCAEHSSNQMALPQFGLYSSVRVCSDCFNDPSWKSDTPPPSLTAVNIVADSSSSLDDSEVADSRVEAIANQFSQLGVSECKCGMPLCICEAPSPLRDTVTSQGKTSISTVLPYPKPKKAEANPRVKVSTSSSKNGSVFNIGQVTNTSLENSLVDYEVNGEGLREAIKNGDTAAVKKLLSEGVDANYCDKQGMSVLHLAAVFNQTDIAFVLMEHGASLDCKNSQGETPLDCAPVMLQYKMTKKIEDLGMGTRNIT